MTHWDIACAFMTGAFLGLCAFAGYVIGGGLIG
jgi:hypothetical protein